MYSPPAQTRDHRLLSFLVVILLVMTGVLVYWPGLRGPFVFDDLTNILQVPQLRIKELNPVFLWQAASAREFDTFIGRPIPMLSFALNFYFAEFSTFGFKAVNLAIHLLNGVLIYFLTRSLLARLLKLSPGNNTDTPDQLEWACAAITALWLLHPLNLTSVLYIVQRMNSLSAFFMLAGLLLYVAGRKQIDKGNRHGLATIGIGVPVAGTLSVLCKENGVLLLAFIFLLEIVLFRFSAHPVAKRPFLVLWTILVALPILLGIVYFAVGWERFMGPVAYQHRDFTLTERLLTESRVLWFYLRLIVVPLISHMGIYHDDFGISRGLTEPMTTLTSLLGLSAAIVLFFVTLRRAPVIAFSAAWFLIGHSLESTVIALELVHEHRNYLPMYGVVFGAGYFMLIAWPSPGKMLPIRRGAIVALAIFLSASTASRAHQWQSEQMLYYSEVINHPGSPRAHTMLAAWYHTNRFYPEAEIHFLAAVDLSGNKPEYHVRLIQHLLTKGKTVPEKYLAELEYLTKSSRVSSVTLWVYEPFLRQSRKHPKLRKRILQSYETMIQRTDIRFPKIVYEGAYLVLAKEHLHDRRDQTALRYVQNAQAINPARAETNILMAEIFLRHGCYNQAMKPAEFLATLSTTLLADEPVRIERISKQLANRSGRDACALPTNP